METTHPPLLQLPSFLYGPYSAIERQTKEEGLRCAKHYQINGALPQPHELRTVGPGDVVFTHHIVDFQEEYPAWRLYMATEAMMSFSETDEYNYRHLDRVYEACFRATAWGALHFAIAGNAPQSATRMAQRLTSVLGFWDSLQHGRYLHQKLNTFLNLEELLTVACGWTLDAWCPKESGSIRSRFEVAAERMARATREDCVEAILRRIPLLLTSVDRRKINHPEVVMNATSWREHLDTLDAEEFERICAVHPGEVLRELYQWDRQLDVQ